MTRLAGYGGAAVGVLQRDALIFVSYRMAFVSQILTLLFSLVLFYYISRMVTIGGFSSPDAYYAFAVVGLLALDVVNNATVHVPTHLRSELVMGTFERLVLSPFGAVGGAVSMMLFPFFWTIVKGTVALALATLLFGLPVQWPGAILAVPVVALAVLSFGPIGLLVTSLVLVLKQALGLSGFIVAAISIVAGFYFPVALLPGWVSWMSEIQPFTPAIELMRATLVGMETSQPAWLAVAKLVGFAAVLAPLSLWVMSKAVKLSRRRGTIIEY